MQKTQFIKIVDSIAPFDTQYEWDNSGVQVNLGHRDVKKVLVALEINNAVIDEAIEAKADMILTHHPLMFEGQKTIDVNNVVQNYVIRLVQADIEVVSSHTPFDAVKGGNNDYLMNLMGVKSPKGMKDPCCRIGKLDTPVSFEKFLCRLDEVLNSPGIRFYGDLDRKITSVACCTGAGSEFVSDAVAMGADVFVTGDVKHHEAQAAKEQGICLVDAGHWGTEQIFVPNMAVKLKAKAKSLTVMMSTVNQNPFDSIM